MKNQFMKELRTKSINELQKILNEKQIELRNLNVKSFRFNGSSQQVRNYPNKKEEKNWGNIRNIRKDIARIKTVLNQKLNYGV